MRSAESFNFPGSDFRSRTTCENRCSISERSAKSRFRGESGVSSSLLCRSCNVAVRSLMRLCCVLKAADWRLLNEPGGTERLASERWYRFMRRALNRGRDSPISISCFLTFAGWKYELSSTQGDCRCSKARFIFRTRRFLECDSARGVGDIVSEYADMKPLLTFSTLFVNATCFLLDCIIWEKRSLRLFCTNLVFVHSANKKDSRFCKYSTSLM
mmetsp:Transcript_1916/g.6855  ORF Transcript_1916/g.6855 Transcript_1916/m.6855 type:complete len:214 (-) Transcript_1916:175-816(-)